MERRVAARKRVLKHGTVEFRKHTLPCKIIDLSENGAGLALPDANQIPIFFTHAASPDVVLCVRTHQFVFRVSFQTQLKKAASADLRAFYTVEIRTMARETPTLFTDRIGWSKFTNPGLAIFILELILSPEGRWSYCQRPFLLSRVVPGTPRQKLPD
jgi:hypothetical protein